jgi:formylglycine-generating enzyme
MKEKNYFIVTALFLSLFILLSGCNGSTENGSSISSTSSISNYAISLVKVDGGTFTLGSDATTDTKINPAHSVTVSSFYISKYETTFEEFDAYTDANGLTRITDTYGNGRGKYPVYGISWYDAVEYANWKSAQDGLTPVYTIDKVNKDANNLQTDAQDTKKWTVTANWDASGYRLPTEAEWEFAAKGGTLTQGYTYSGDNSADLVAWYKVTTGAKGAQHPVGTKKANELGLYDFSGNVHEYVWDKYDTTDTTRSGYNAVTETTDPKGISGNFSRFIIRGGQSGAPLSCLRPSKRFTKTGIFTMCPTGFRLVKKV